MILTAIEAVDGVTASETSAGAPTVTGVEAVTEPELTWIVVLPSATGVTRPAELTVAADDEEVHVAVDVKSCVVPSE